MLATKVILICIIYNYNVPVLLEWIERDVVSFQLVFEYWYNQDLQMSIWWVSMVKKCQDLPELLVWFVIREKRRHQWLLWEKRDFLTCQRSCDEQRLSKMQKRKKMRDMLPELQRDVKRPDLSIELKGEVMNWLGISFYIFIEVQRSRYLLYINRTALDTSIKEGNWVASKIDWRAVEVDALVIAFRVSLVPLHERGCKE